MVWQYATRCEIEVVDVAAEGHHRPSLDALRAQEEDGTFRFRPSTAFHALGLDLTAAEVAEACTRRRLLL